MGSKKLAVIFMGLIPDLGRYGHTIGSDQAFGWKALDDSLLRHVSNPLLFSTACIVLLRNGQRCTDCMRWFFRINERSD